MTTRRFNVGNRVRSVLTPTFRGTVVSIETALDGATRFVCFKTASGEISDAMREQFIESDEERTV